mgnify:FL=1
MNEKALVTESRKHESLRRWGSSEFNRLEQKYGKYLFVPLDVPLIKSNKHNELVEFYYQHAKLAERIKEDIAGSMDDTYRAKFLSLNSSDTEADDVWTKTYKPEFENTFKDPFDQIYEYLPIQKDTKISYTIWSTQSPVVMHRDHTSLLDLPLNFRIKLYDNNPSETLLIKNSLNSKFNHISKSSIFVMPFYNITESNKIVIRISNKFLYVSTGFRYKNHYILISAFKNFFNKYKTGELHLTIGNEYKNLIILINTLKL